MLGFRKRNESGAVQHERETKRNEQRKALTGDRHVQSLSASTHPSPESLPFLYINININKPPGRALSIYNRFSVSPTPCNSRIYPRFSF